MTKPVPTRSSPRAVTLAGVLALSALNCGRSSSPAVSGPPDASARPGDFVWRASGFAGGSRPATDGDAVYVVGRDKIVRAFDRATGAPRWATPLEAPASAFTRDAVVEGGVLVVGADALFGLDPARGTVLWRFRPSAPASVGGGYLLAAGSGAVYAGSNGGPGVVYAVDVRTGAARWTATLPIPVGRQETVSVFDPVLADGRVYVSYTHFPRDSAGRAQNSRGGAAAFDAASGALLWHRPHPSAEGLPTSTGTGVAADGSTVIATAADAAVYALDAATGQARWAVPPLPNLPNTRLDLRPNALGSEIAAVGDWRGEVTAYRRSDGAVLWRRAALPASVLNVAVDADNVYVTYASGQLAAQATTDGHTRWVFETANIFFNPPRPVGNVLYASGAEGLAAIRAR